MCALLYNGALRDHPAASGTYQCPSKLERIDSIFVVCGTHRIRLEFWIVDKRCAITSVVCCFISLSNASWTAASLSESRALVASAEEEPLLLPFSHCINTTPQRRQLVKNEMAGQQSARHYHLREGQLVSARALLQ